jgi:hypothetical protein
VFARAFYTLADSSYILGLVALVNSLRLVGHREPVFVLDCGLTDPQRHLIAPEATAVPLPGPIFPPLAKALTPLLHPAREMLLVDSDVIVTRSLTPLFEEAGSGRVVGFADPVSPRFDRRWSELLGLPEQQPHPYVNGGLLALGEESLPLLEEFERLRPQLDPETSYFKRGSPADPFYYADQDLLNALLGARLRPGQLIVHDQRLAPQPPFAGLALAARGVGCSYADGSEPFHLHHTHTRKPWRDPTRASVYTQLLSRLLVGPDLPIAPPLDWVPLRLRTGKLAAAARLEGDLRGRVAENRGRLGIRRRLGGRVRAAAVGTPVGGRARAGAGPVD